MLSAHEFATLMLVQSAPDQIDLDREDLNALLEHQLVALQEMGSGRRRPCLTPNGQSFVRAVARVR
ncbi:hypothetical protein [Burkholderia pseudomultivorans]|uniref:Preprotein translocase subunit SecA n=1 Tax=Burkholderia pseudomultivorans TaxID=1207504 RepID=A0ABU2EDA9_9BURK|nr:hypothetical protein [Burkholderia pseudomultivorans]MDR8730434.1 hypothetical protein [Burkholderia pseudomultivorans]MDR8738863.1 hypothetical protein [Burkholderia pseudomultivorans]MDR8745448.1 hypothetical protein [Burkholderia pseudomultivorans]MDR8757568.1 hypothetical protein [Burkholderia pseudomultivorans]MDR8781736.1 hypothetical protein [Burkholderia pseudomultivorans]